MRISSFMSVPLTRPITLEGDGESEEVLCVPLDVTAETEELLNTVQKRALAAAESGGDPNLVVHETFSRWLAEVVYEWSLENEDGTAIRPVYEDIVQLDPKAVITLKTKIQGLLINGPLDRSSTRSGNTGRGTAKRRTK